MLHRSLPILFILGILTAISCTEAEEHVAEAVGEHDSLPFMHSIGVSSFISDSGIVRYHLVAEEWDIFEEQGKAATWKFRKGLFMKRFDKDFHIDLYVHADTAYLHEQRTWELRGRVRVRNVQGTVFITEELFWDMNMHEMWNYTYMHIISPDRQLDGYNFRSNETMTRYSVTSSSGDFPAEDKGQDSDDTDGTDTPDSTAAEPQAAPDKMERINALNRR